jgi:hypothetical protein
MGNIIFLNMSVYQLEDSFNLATTFSLTFKKRFYRMTIIFEQDKF